MLKVRNLNLMHLYMKKTTYFVRYSKKKIFLKRSLFKIFSKKEKVLKKNSNILKYCQHFWQYLKIVSISFYNIQYCKSCNSICQRPDGHRAATLLKLFAEKTTSCLRRCSESGVHPTTAYKGTHSINNRNKESVFLFCFLLYCS